MKNTGCPESSAHGWTQLELSGARGRSSRSLGTDSPTFLLSLISSSGITTRERTRGQPGRCFCVRSRTRDSAFMISSNGYRNRLIRKAPNSPEPEILTANCLEKKWFSPEPCRSQGAKLRTSPQPPDARLRVRSEKGRPSWSSAIKTYVNWLDKQRVPNIQKPSG